MNLPIEAPHQQIDPSAIHASLGFLLCAAVEVELPDQEVFIEHSFLGGYYCHFANGYRISADDLQRLNDRLSTYVHGDTPLELLEMNRRELLQIYKKSERTDKVEILKNISIDSIPVARFNDFCDYRFEPMITDLTKLRKFSLDAYDDGFVLRFPSPIPPYEIAPFVDSPKLYQIIHQRHEWGRALHINNLKQLNQALDGADFRETIMVAEGLHEKMVAEIADGLIEHGERRAIFVSGPSSSGKTTFAKRLGIQLKVNGLSTLGISMDSYFMDQADMTPLEDGTLDFENLDSLNVDLLAADIKKLLAGETIPLREYSFKEGRGYETDEQLVLPDDAYLVVEGIHGLNPVFTDKLGRGKIQRIYISAITQLNIDNEHRISSADNRLLRRMVRDHQFRGYGAEDTILRWPSVRLGEEKNIFRYQESADFMFNSALIYELAILRPVAEKMLLEVSDTSRAYSEAQRLLTFLSFVNPIDAEPVPRNSILREFLGNSAFSY